MAVIPLSIAAIYHDHSVYRRILILTKKAVPLIFKLVMVHVVDSIWLGNLVRNKFGDLPIRICNCHINSINIYGNIRFKSTDTFTRVILLN